MPWIRSTSDRKYYGLSTDEKPYRGLQHGGTTVSSSDLPQGTQFYEIDTGNTAIFQDTGPSSKGEWVYMPKSPRDDVVGKLDELQNTLALLLETQKEMLLLMSGS